jgi:hypothetical protein
LPVGNSSALQSHLQILTADVEKEKVTATEWNSKYLRAVIVHFLFLPLTQLILAKNHMAVIHWTRIDHRKRTQQ